MTMTFKPLILIPSYNSGLRLVSTVAAAMEHGYPVWLLVDGSDDGSDKGLQEILAEGSGENRLIRFEKNRGKGAVLLSGARLALQDGFTHVLTLDSDGQHPADKIPVFLAAAQLNPGDLIMGRPIFGKDVPAARLKGRKLTIWWTDLETHFCGLGDTLFGMRVYPLAGYVAAMEQTRFARGFDFDPEIAVRMAWAGHRPRAVDAPVRYYSKTEGGVSHFNYLRDNIKLTLLHFRLVPEWILLRWFSMRHHVKKWRQET